MKEEPHLTGKVNSNLSFRWTADKIPGWNFRQTVGNEATIRLCKANPLHAATPTSLEIDLKEGDQAILSNSGFWGMNIREKENYFLRFYLRKNIDYVGDIVMKLESEKGTILFQKIIKLKEGNGWNEYKYVIVPNVSDTKAKLVFEFNNKGKVWLDYVSLFPEETFQKRTNGLRKDVAETLQNLKPAFLRWPGGCIVEGITLSNRIKWKETLGDPMTRPGIYDTWGYHATMGFGYHEFLQFCEDIGADGMFVCNAGLGCQGRVGDACPENEVPYFIEDVLDAIDYAIGDENTVWGKKRIDQGHPLPFPLKYVEIGNENWGEVYAKRYDKFYKAIKSKYPQLTLISTLGLGGQLQHEKVDMIDPHWYVTPDAFFMNDSIFDRQKRGDYKIYVGEYACNVDVGSGNLLGALGEAAFLTGMERNSDIVKMASYAPLLENVNDRVWPVNLIWLDSYRVMGRSSYYVQKMFADNRPSYNLKTTLKQPQRKVDVSGKIGVGTWDTQAEYKDIVITKSDGKIVKVNLLQAATEWDPMAGEWESKGNAYIQKASGQMKWSVWQNNIEGNYTIDLKAKKIGGKEGFMIFFGVSNANGYLLNIGGWGNNSSAFEKLNDGKTFTIPGSIPQKIENDKWYAIRIAVHDGELAYYMDNQLLLKVPISRKCQYVISGFDRKTREIIIKIVNAQEKPFTTDIRLENIEVESEGKIITLSSLSEKDENTLDKPFKIIPKKKHFTRFGSSFQYQLEPWSFTIMRIKTKEI